MLCILKTFTFYYFNAITMNEHWTLMHMSSFSEQYPLVYITFFLTVLWSQKVGENSSESAEFSKVAMKSIQEISIHSFYVYIYYTTHVYIMMMTVDEPPHFNFYSFVWIYPATAYLCIIIQRSLYPYKLLAHLKHLANCVHVHFWFLIACHLHLKSYEMASTQSLWFCFIIIITPGKVIKWNGVSSAISRGKTTSMNCI